MKYLIRNNRYSAEMVESENWKHSAPIKFALHWVRTVRTVLHLCSMECDDLLKYCE